MIPTPAAGATVAALALAGVLVLPHTAASPASTGAGIQAGPVRVTAAPGTTRQAHVIVMNTGSGTETLAVRGYQLASHGRTVPASWARTASVTLAPGAEGTSLVTVTVPPGTAPGRYRGAILASTAPGAPGGLSFGAGALADLVVTVTPPDASSHTLAR